MRDAYAKREVFTNSVGQDLASSRSDVVIKQSMVFMKSLDFGTSGDPKITLGPALARRLRLPRGNGRRLRFFAIAVSACMLLIILYIYKIMYMCMHIYMYMCKHLAFCFLRL